MHDVAPSRRRYDWEAAFQIWVGLGPQRDLPKVAAAIGASEKSVSRASKRLGWKDRLARLQQKAADKADDKLIRAREERVEDTLRIIDAARTRFAGQLARSEFRLTGSDFVGLIKLEALLEGEATDRVAIGDVRVLIDAVLVVARKFVDDPTGTVDERRTRFLSEVRQLPVPGIEHREAA